MPHRRIGPVVSRPGGAHGSYPQTRLSKRGIFNTLAKSCFLDLMLGGGIVTSLTWPEAYSACNQSSLPIPLCLGPRKGPPTTVAAPAVWRARGGHLPPSSMLRASRTWVLCGAWGAEPASGVMSTYLTS